VSRLSKIFGQKEAAKVHEAALFLVDAVRNVSFLESVKNLPGSLNQLQVTFVIRILLMTS
jgi:hypothetical protein